MTSRAVFLDKDGTLVDDVPYNVDPALIRLSRGAAAGVRALHQSGYQLHVVTNQSGIAHGYFSESALRVVEQRLRELLAEAGVPLSGFYFCPHHPEGIAPELTQACDCRKPLPGLLLRAARERNIDLVESWMVGDILNDVEAGNRAGCRTVLIDNGGETEWQGGLWRDPDFRVPDLQVAAAVITSAVQQPDLDWSQIAKTTSGRNASCQRSS